MVRKINITLRESIFAIMKINGLYMSTLGYITTIETDISDEAGQKNRYDQDDACQGFYISPLC